MSLFPLQPSLANNFACSAFSFNRLGRHTQCAESGFQAISKALGAVPKATLKNPFGIVWLPLTVPSNISSVIMFHPASNYYAKSNVATRWLQTLLLWTERFALECVRGFIFIPCHFSILLKDGKYIYIYISIYGSGTSRGLIIFGQVQPPDPPVTSILFPKNSSKSSQPWQVLAFEEHSDPALVLLQHLCRELPCLQEIQGCGLKILGAQGATEKSGKKTTHEKTV